MKVQRSITSTMTLRIEKRDGCDAPVHSVGYFLFW